MSTVANWWFSQSGIGIVGIYTSDYGYAGGLALAGFGDTYNTFGVTNLGGGKIALSVELTSEADGNSYTLYLNSHYQVSNDPSNNSGILLWNGNDPVYSSDSIGSEQTFLLVNLGGGNVALQATGGAFSGQYLSGMQYGWYPEQWGMGSGSFYATSSPSAFQLHGALLPILIITNSAYQLNLSGQSLAGINLTNANMQQCNLSQADLSGITGLQGADFTSANLQGANLSGLSLAGANWTQANFTSTSLVSIQTAQGANLTEANLTQAVLTNVNLQTATLSGANLSSASCEGSNLSGATLSNITAPSANFQNANLANAAFTGANLTGAVLDGADLSGADLTGANLSGASLVNANLTGANLTNSNFTSCTVTGMTLANNTITGANFSGLDLTPVTFTSPVQPTDPNNPANFSNGTLPFAVFGTNWSCLDLTSTTITGLPTDLSGLMAVSVRRPNSSFQNFNLNNSNFAQANLTNSVFTSASLTSAKFDGANLTGAVFTRAKINETTFIGAALGGVSQNQGAAFSFAYLANCDFSQANLFGATFAGATLVGSSNLGDSSNLQETDFANAYLPNVDFTGADLQGAKFDGAFMVECNLTNTNLSPTRDGSVMASLTSACLQAVTFQQTNLVSVDLSNAAITDTAGTITMQYYDENGQLTQPFPLPYPAGSFPDPSSFGAQTICPNGSTYSSNQQDGLSLAQMMEAPNPPTSWSPVDQAADAAKGRVPAPTTRSGVAAEISS
jgi:uncharacterized protein YjbI with pentapeptide repeats